MKLKKLIPIGMISLLLLTACGDATVKEVENDGSSRFKGIDGTVKVITDSETGCKYIFVEDGFSDTRTEAMSPLLKDSTSYDCD